MGKKLSKKSLLSMGFIEIRKMKVKDQLRPLVKEARELYKKQRSVFESHPNTYSYALEKMEEFYSDRGGAKTVAKMNKKELQTELYRLQDFFSAKSSTLTGARKISRDANARIFGVNESTGRPNRSMTLAQSKEFWAIYNEFKNLEGESYVRNMGSNTVLQELGQMIIGHFRSNRGDSTYFYASDFKRLKDRLEERKKQEEWAKDDLDAERKILSGKWADL